MKLTQNQKIALNDLKNTTIKKSALTSQGASIIISMLCDLHADNKDLKEKLNSLKDTHRTNGKRLKVYMSNTSREEQQELLAYLEKNCWDYKEF